MKIFGNRISYTEQHKRRVAKMYKKGQSHKKILCGLTAAYLISISSILMISNTLAEAVELTNTTEASIKAQRIGITEMTSMEHLKLQTVSDVMKTVNSVNPVAAAIKTSAYIEPIDEEMITEPTQTPEPEPEPEPIDYYQDDFTSYSSVMTSSNLTAEQIEGMLSDYPGLDGLGEAIYNTEQTYGVNAYYTLAVASLESGYGKSAMAQSKNNLFGMLGCSFETKEGSVDYFGELMTKYQNRLGADNMNPASINPIYCTSSNTWAGTIASLMNQWAHKANDMY